MDHRRRLEQRRNAFSAGESSASYVNTISTPRRLPSRLSYLLSSLTPDLARLITTDSYDLPVPSTLPTRDYAALMLSQNTGGTYPDTPPVGLSIVDLLRAKLIAVQAGHSGGDQHRDCHAVAAGDRRRIGFDINRPFGNGIDDDGDGIIDEPDEYSTQSEASPVWKSILGTSSAIPFD